MSFNRNKSASKPPSWTSSSFLRNGNTFRSNGASGNYQTTYNSSYSGTNTENGLNIIGVSRYIPNKFSPPTSSAALPQRYSKSFSDNASGGSAPFPVQRVTLPGFSEIDYIKLYSQIAQITEHLYLSSAHPVNEARMRQLGVSLVVNATLDVRPIVSNDIETFQVPVDDNPFASLRSYFDRVADRIHAEVKNGKKVLVHCVAGVSRSSSLVLAYLMKHEQMTLKEAHSLVKSRRSFIRPNNGFWQQLSDYEERLFGVRSVKMVNTPLGVIPDIYAHELNLSSSSVWTPSFSAPVRSVARIGRP